MFELRTFVAWVQHPLIQIGTDIRYSYNNFFLLAMLVVLINAIGRLPIAVNKFYGCVLYDMGPFSQKIYVGNELAKVTSFLPVYIILCIEVIIIIIFPELLTRLTPLKLSSS